MSNRQQQYEYRKGQIIQIALDQFIERGFFGTSTRKICELAGISSGLMFHYFDSKEALYEELIELGCTKLVLEKKEGMSPLEIFHHQLHELFLLIEENKFAAKMFVFMGYALYNSDQISEKATRLLEDHNITRESIPLIEEGQRLGEIRQGNPEALATAFWSSIQGIAESIALNPKRPIPQEEWILAILKA